MDHKQIESYLLELPEAWLDYPFGKEVAVYKTGPKNSPESKMFALIAENSNPLRLSLKCDPKLSLLLREKYETVLPGYHLNKKHWNTVAFNADVSDKLILELLHNSYQLVWNKLPRKEREALTTR